MISYRLAVLLPRCSRLALSSTLFKQGNLKIQRSTYKLHSLCISRPKILSVFTWQNEIPQCSLYTPIRAVQTANKDSVSKEVIYRGELRTNIKMLKILTLSTSIGGLFVQPAVLNKLWHTNPYLTYGIGIFSTFFIMVTPLLVHLFTKRYVTELSFNPVNKTFTATTFTLFITKKEITFTAEDVYVPTIPGFFTTFLVNNVPLFVDSESVTNIEAYQHLMGFDKPIDFYLEKSTNSKDNEN